MRKPAEVLELALTLLDKYEGSYFMCFHLDWLSLKGYIDDIECRHTQHEVRKAIRFRTTLCSYLWEFGDVPMAISSSDAEFRPYQVKFYTDLINKLKQEESQ